MIRCGNCKGRHANVATVKTCYAGPEAEEAARAAGWSSAVSAVQDHRNCAREDLRRAADPRNEWVDEEAQREEARREAYRVEAMDRLRRMITTPTRGRRS